MLLPALMRFPEHDLRFHSGWKLSSINICSYQYDIHKSIVCFSKLFRKPVTTQVNNKANSCFRRNDELDALMLHSNQAEPLNLS